MIKNKATYNSILAITCFILASCGAEKTGWFAKKYHNTTARYNRYYHGNIILEEAKQSLIASHSDDFNEVLKVYPLGETENFATNAGQMDEIVKKAAHVLVKHPRSKWIDDVYLLVGKSHFYKGDFFSAIDVFNFIYSKYPDEEMKSEAQLWVAKSYVMQKKYLEAEALLDKIEMDDQPSRYLKGQIRLVAAAVSLEQGKKSQGASHLEKSIPYLSKKKDNTYRYHFILGQLYEEMGKYDSAIKHYQIVKKHNPPYNFEFNSKLKAAKLLGGSGNKKAENILKKMLKDDKNIDFFDQIYYELANAKLMQGDKLAAITYFEKSAAAGSDNKVQKSNTYLALGELYFEIPNYEKSQSYYDSAGIFLDEEHPKFEKLAQRNEVLGDLIVHLVTYREQDSLLRMAKDEVFREQVIDRLIEIEENKKEEEEEDNANTGQFLNNPNQQNQNSAFPFYNTIAKAKGYNEFIQKWGRRPNTDNWRISNLQNQETKEEEKKDSTIIDEKLKENIPNVPEDRKKYYVGIPFSEKDQLDANNKKEQALYESGKIYKDGLYDYPEAINSFQSLLKAYPSTVFKETTLYYLMQCYENLNDTIKSLEYKRKLEENFPDGDYTKIANGIIVEKDEGGFDKENEKLYIRMYESYKKKQFDSAFIFKEKHDEAFFGDQMQIKFDYLEALIYGAQGAMKKYEEALKNVAGSYENTPQAEDASLKLIAIDKRRDPEKYKNIEKEKAFNITYLEGMYFLLKVDNLKDINRFKTYFSDYNRKEFRLEKLELTSFIYDAGTYIILVKNFSSLKIAKEYILKAKRRKEIKEKVKDESNYVLISSDNFNKVLKEKSFDKYKEIFANFQKTHE